MATTVERVPPKHLITQSQAHPVVLATSALLRLIKSFSVLLDTTRPMELSPNAQFVQLDRSVLPLEAPPLTSPPVPQDISALLMDSLARLLASLALTRS